MNQDPAVVQAATTALLAEVTAATLPAVNAAHTAYWGRFWNASAVSLPGQPLIEAYYYRSLYLLGSASSASSAVPPGLCGAWFAGSGPPRYGDFTLNYNFQAIYYGVYEAGVEIRTTLPTANLCSRTLMDCFAPP